MNTVRKPNDSGKPIADGNEAVERTETDPEFVEGMQAWAVETLLAAYLEPVDELRRQAHTEGLTPAVLRRLRAVQLAALGGRVGEREAEQVMFVRLVEAHLPAIRSGSPDERLLTFAVQRAFDGAAAESLASIPLDRETLEVLHGNRNAVYVSAWLMVRAGALVDHKPVQPIHAGFGEAVERARNKLKNAISKLR